MGPMPAVRPPSTMRPAPSTKPASALARMRMPQPCLRVRRRARWIPLAQCFEQVGGSTERSPRWAFPSSPARRHGANAARPVLGRQLLGQRQEAGLGRAIGRLGDRSQRIDGGDVDDRAASSEQGWQHRTRHEPRARQVEVEFRPPARRVGGLERLGLAPPASSTRTRIAPAAPSPPRSSARPAPRR